jgi:hypothetical protein
MVDTGIYSNHVTCQCGNTRWVKNADVFQVDLAASPVYTGPELSGARSGFGPGGVARFDYGHTSPA